MISTGGIPLLRDLVKIIVISPIRRLAELVRYLLVFMNCARNMCFFYRVEFTSPKGYTSGGSRLRMFLSSTLMQIIGGGHIARTAPLPIGSQHPPPISTIALNFAIDFTLKFHRDLVFVRYTDVGTQCWYATEIASWYLLALYLFGPLPYFISDNRIFAVSIYFLLDKPYHIYILKPRLGIGQEARSIAP